MTAENLEGHVAICVAYPGDVRFGQLKRNLPLTQLDLSGPAGCVARRAFRHGTDLIGTPAVPGYDYTDPVSYLTGTPLRSCQLQWFS